MGKLLLAALIIIMVASFKATYNQRLILAVVGVGLLIYMRSGNKKQY